MIEKKINVLVQIAEKLNLNNLTWVLGSSMMLYLRGIVESFDDIDILVCEEDIVKAQNILDNLGTKNPRNPNKQYATKLFLEYVIDGIDVDVMAGLTIISNGLNHYFPLDKNQNYQSVTIDGETIHLDTIDNWLKYYKLMERLDKVEIIKNYLQTKK